VQSATIEPVLNPIARHADVKQLRPSDHAMLTSGQLSHGPIDVDRIWHVNSAVDSGLLGHGPSVARTDERLARGMRRN
jgi:hypothetical protein